MNKRFGIVLVFLFSFLGLIFYGTNPSASAAPNPLLLCTVLRPDRDACIKAVEACGNDDACAARASGSAFSNQPNTAAVVIPPEVRLIYNQTCNIKRDKAGCIRAYERCKLVVACVKGVDDRVAVPSTFRNNIHAVCQRPDIPNAQACDPIVTNRCRTFTEALQQAKCKEGVYLELIASPSGAAGGPAGPAGSGGATGAGDLPSLAPKFPGETSTCGRGKQAVVTKFNLGCEHKVDNPIIDMVYAFIKFLTIGVGLVITISIIFAGIMYTTSGGNPEQTSKAKDRIMNAMIGLIFYLLISAFADFLIPGGLF